MTYLKAHEKAELSETFPELSWMRPEDWENVAEFLDWDGIEDLSLRENRIQVRTDCRAYFGVENVPNVLDPDEPTWA